MRTLLPVALSWGVTTIRMTGNDKPEIMHVYSEAREGKFPSPRVYSAGQGFNINGPYPGAPTLHPATPEEARAGVQAHKALNVDFIKIWMPGFTPEIVAAIVDEAKSRGSQSWRTLATPPRYVSSRIWASPTLCTKRGMGQSRWFYYEHPEFLKMDPKFDGFYARGRAMLEDPARKQEIIGAADFADVKKRFKDNNYPFIKMMSDAGVRLVTGTDCGAEASQTTPVGHTTHSEVAMFVEAGVPPLAALRDATLDAARVLERTENPSYGSIQSGKGADLVLLDGDPTVDINNIDKISKVMRAGKWVP